MHTDAGVVEAVPGQSCFGCHSHEYAGSTKPPHQVLEFNKDCSKCHSKDAWHPATGFDHQEIWPLTGAHVGPACAACHGDFAKALDSACVACHLDDYQGAVQPNHVAQNTSKACQNCHSTLAWKPALAIDHDLFWPLTGKHKGAKCESCHKTPGDKPSKACSGCHLPAYQGSKDPDHVKVGFPTTCEKCHSTAAWKPASGFDHNLYYPLTNKHATAACSACHTSPGVKPAKVCSACHMPAYQAATNPNHKLLGLPTTCEKCHGTAGWKPAGFPNHKFPITSGDHNQACVKCHTDPANFAAFSCISGGCHTAAKTNGKHDEEPDYSYTSAACYKCHPQGKE